MYALYLRPKLTYTLACCSLTPDQCHIVQSPALASLLPKLHLNCHSPRTILFAGPTYGGFGLTDLYIDQCFVQFTLFISHLKLEDENGALILSLLSHLQLTVGSANSVLSLPYSTYCKWIDNTWLTSIWWFTAKLNIVLQVEHHWIPPTARLHDIATTVLAAHYNFATQQLAQINACCLYLQVLWILDIVTGYGITLLQTASAGHRDHSRQSTLHWPLQAYPSTWMSWTLFLQNVYMNNKLTTPLGHCIQCPHQHWMWFYDDTTDKIYTQSPKATTTFYILLRNPLITRRGNMLFGNPHTGPRPSQEGTPITVEEIRPSLYRDELSLNPFPDTTDIPQPSLWDEDTIPPAFKNTPKFFQHLFIGAEPLTQSHCEDIAEEIRDSSLLICSDGAYNPLTKSSGHGWVVASEKRHTISSGAGPDHSHPDFLSAYCSELGGIVAVLYLVSRICQCYDIESGKVTLFCDNKGALAKVFKKPPPGITPFPSSDYDLIYMAYTIINLLPTTIVGVWVKSHYTGKNRKIQHDLNDAANALASGHCNTQPHGWHSLKRPTPNPRLQSETVISKLRHHFPVLPMLASICHEQDLKTYILKKTKWTSFVFTSIDWPAHKSAFNKPTRHQKITTAKLIHNLANTNRQNFL